MRNHLRDFDWIFLIKFYLESQDAISVLVELLIKDIRPDEAWSMLQHTEYTYPEPQFKDRLEWGKWNKTLPDILWSQVFFRPLSWKYPTTPTADLCKLSDYGIKSKDEIMVPDDPNHTVDSAIATLSTKCQTMHLLHGLHFFLLIVIVCAISYIPIRFKSPLDIPDQTNAH
jgi:hypothetical protein